MSMRSGPLFALILVLPAASAQSFAVVSAASYAAVVAPDSLATIFGVNLAGSAASAQLDANGQLPTQLAGTTVTVDGQAASLIYVSPTQINFLIPDATTLGMATVVVQSSITGGSQTATAQVQNTAPGMFTSDASGKGAGSILNAVTYAGPPFLVETPQNGGSDLRTRLAVYGTGLRYSANPSHDPSLSNDAANITAQGQDSSGNRYNFTVEYAGAAPGYFGLDQVNIVLPPELDGAGVVSLTLITDLAASNPVTFQMGSLPDGSIRLAGLTLAQSFAVAGDSVTATVSLNAPARSAGVPVSLRASSPAAVLPLTVTIPAGSASAQFSIVTSSAVSTVQTVTITAQSGGVTETAALEIDPPNSLQLSGFAVAPASVQGGHTATATVTLSGAAPAGGTKVQISSDNAAAQAPASATVPFGSNSTTVSISTSTVTATTTAILTATLGRNSITAQLTVAPVLQVTLSNSAVTGGSSAGGTVTIGDPAPLAGVNVTLQSDNQTIAQAPASVTIPSGQNSAAFTVTTIAVAVSRTVTITARAASLGQAIASATLTVTPPGSGTLSALAVSPAQVAGGANVTGTVTLTGPAPGGGTVVNVSSNSAYAQVPQLVTVPQGVASATFTITTTHPPSTQTATITATAGGTSKTATLTVQ